MGVKKELVSGAIYVGIARYLGMALSILITMVLSRKLTPGDYGVVALASVMLAFFNILGEIGIHAAVIQNKTLTAKDMNSLHTFTLYMGIVLGTLFFLISPLIAQYYDNAEVLVICRWLSISILLSCARAVPSGILYRNQMFKLTTQLSIIMQILTGSASIVMAYMGYGAKALVIPQVILGAVTLLVFKYYAQVHFVLRMDIQPLKRIFGFSAYQFLTNISAYITRNLDSMLVGKFIGLKPLGYYNKSFHLMRMPMDNVSGVLMPVMLPVFSKHQDDKVYILDKYSQILRLFFFIGVPLATTLFFCADELVLFLYGDQWGPSVPCFKILALSVPFQMMGCTSGAIFQSIGRTNSMFWNSLIGSVITLSGVAIGIIYFRTIEALAWSYSLSIIVTTFICFYILYRALGSTMGRFLQILIQPLLLGVILCAVLILVSLIPFQVYYVKLFVKLAVGVLFSAGYVQYWGFYDVNSLVKKLYYKIRRR